MNIIKKLILVLSFTLLVVTTLSAQVNTDSINKANAVDAENYIPQSDFRKVRLGIAGALGVSFMNPKTEGYEKDGSKFSYKYGLLVDYNITKNYTFSSGIYFNSLGGKLKYQDSLDIKDDNVFTQGDMNRSYRVNYLEIPTMLKLKTNQMGYLTYFTQLGLRHNFRLSSYSNDIFEYGTESTIANDDVDMVDNTSFYRLSFNVGIGAEYALSQSFSAFAYFEFDNGLTNSLTKEKKDGDDKIISRKEDALIKNFSLTLGLLF